MTDLQGNIHSDQENIENAFLTFYKDLCFTRTAPTTPSVDIINSLPNDLPRISDTEATRLIQEVTKEEVYCTIFDLPTGKFPGPNGFNVEFFRKFWLVIGEHLFSAIQFFFEHSIMSSS